MSTMKHLFGASLLLLTLLFFTQCKDDDSPTTTGTARIEITDGPIDDANVKGVFVTVTAVKVDDQEISGFSKQTIDLMAYQQGETKLLGSLDLKTGTYDEVELVLDYAKDADGNAPGSYVLTQDNVKHSLQATSQATGEVEASKGSFEVEEGATTDVVVDFDLRKAIRYDDAPTGNDQYDFVSENELEGALRIVAKASTGEVSGQIADNLGLAGDKVVVYAYEKGSFDKSEEIKGQGTSSITFKNAVTSAAADAQGNYTLAFLEAGEYELHFFGYEDVDNDGQMELKGELELSLLGNLGLDLNDLTVGANSSVEVSVNVTGILP